VERNGDSRRGVKKTSASTLAMGGDEGKRRRGRISGTPIQEGHVKTSKKRIRGAKAGGRTICCRVPEEGAFVRAWGNSLEIVREGGRKSVFNFKGRNWEKGGTKGFLGRL